MSDPLMALPEGKTCAECLHVKRCTAIFGVKETNVECDFYPVRYYDRAMHEKLNADG